MMATFDEKIYYSILVAIVTLFLYAFYWYGYGRFQYFKRIGIPYLKAHWFIGNSLNFPKAGMLNSERSLELMKEFKSKTIGLFLMGQPFYITSDVKVIKEINTSKFSYFRDRMMYHDRPYPHNLMLGWMIGERWKTLRTKLAPLFTTSKLKLMMEIMRSASATCTDLLQESVDKNEKANLRLIGTGYSTESILSASFGLEAKSQSETNKRIVKFGTDFFGGQGPIWSLMQWLPYSGYYLQYVPNPMVYAIKKIHEEVVVLFGQRKNGKTRREDLFQYMLDTQSEPEGMTDDEVVGSAINFMSAGQETAGNTLTCSLYLLAKHQEYQERLFQEVKAHWKDTSKPIEYEMFDSLKFLDMFVREVLRFYSPAPGFLRACKRGCTIQGIKFEPYTYVGISTYTVHRDKDAYEKPDEFYPDHFTEEAIQKRDEFYWLPFGCGPRICLGYKFALLEIKVAIATIVRKYKLVPDHDDFPKELTMEQRLTNTVKDLIPCNVEKRLE